METPAAPSPRADTPHKRRWIAAAAGLVVLALAAFLPGLLPQWRVQAGADVESQDQDTLAVAVVTPTPTHPTGGMALPAEIRPWVEAPIYARASGYLKRRLVDIGSRVKEGQLLAEIDTPELNQELERARAQLDQAEASLGLARITANRWNGLLKTASVSEQEAAEKQADFKLKTALTDSARAEVRRLERLQDFSKVLAPFTGTVTVRNVDSGDLIVAAGNKELFHLAQTHRLRVYVQVPQAMARAIAVGQTADVVLPEQPGHTFVATVIRTAGVIAPDSRTLLVELQMDNSKEEILAGSYARLSFKDVTPETVMTLPANTVLFRPEGPVVGVVGPGDVVELRSVRLGRDFGRTIQIQTGVTPEDRVIMNPSDSLTAGAQVSVIEATDKDKKDRP